MAEQGLRIEEVDRSPQAATENFTRRIFRSQGANPIERELFCRSNLEPTTYVLPWFKRDQVYVVVKSGVPRPVLCSHAQDDGRGHRSCSGYVTEPIELPDFREIMAGAGSSVLGVPSRPILSSPGGIDELQRLMPVPVAPEVFEKLESAGHGELHAYPLRELLRMHHRGALRSAALVRGCYHLCHTLDEFAGPWIGSGVVVKNQLLERGTLQIESAAEILRARKITGWQEMWQEISSTGYKQFFQQYRGTFKEFNAEGDEAGPPMIRDYVVSDPDAGLRELTITLVPFCKDHDGRFLTGIEQRSDLPAAALALGIAHLPTLPSYRIPRQYSTFSQIEAFLKERIANEFGLRWIGAFPLGGPLDVSSSFLAEAACYWAVQVEPAVKSDTPLSFGYLRDFLAQLDLIADQHLEIGLTSLGHSLGEIR